MYLKKSKVHWLRSVSVNTTIRVAQEGAVEHCPSWRLCHPCTPGSRKNGKNQPFLANLGIFAFSKCILPPPCPLTKTFLVPPLNKSNSLCTITRVSTSPECQGLSGGAWTAPLSTDVPEYVCYGDIIAEKVVPFHEGESVWVSPFMTVSQWG